MLFATLKPSHPITFKARTNMELTPREKDKLLIFTAALLAERRKAQEEALKQLVGVEGREAFMALVNPK